jgi:hypothetical protein
VVFEPGVSSAGFHPTLEFNFVKWKTSFLTDDIGSLELCFADAMLRPHPGHAYEPRLRVLALAAAVRPPILKESVMEAFLTDDVIALRDLHNPSLSH